MIITIFQQLPNDLVPLIVLYLRRDISCCRRCLWEGNSCWFIGEYCVQCCEYLDGNGIVLDANGMEIELDEEEDSDSISILNDEEESDSEEDSKEERKESDSEEESDSISVLDPFAVCESMQNIQPLVKEDTISKYVLKYIAKVAEE